MKNDFNEEHIKDNAFKIKVNELIQDRVRHKASTISKSGNGWVKVAKVFRNMSFYPIVPNFGTDFSSEIIGD
jgi:hypothetical protein